MGKKIIIVCDKCNEFTELKKNSDICDYCDKHIDSKLILDIRKKKYKCKYCNSRKNVLFTINPYECLFGDNKKYRMCLKCYDDYNYQ